MKCVNFCDMCILICDMCDIRTICCGTHTYINLLVLVHGMGLDFKISPKCWGDQTRKCLVVRLLLPSGQNYGDVSRKL